MPKRLPALLNVLLSLILIPMALMGLGCQPRFIYFPRANGPEVDARLAAAKGRKLFFETSQGRQTAYYVPPRDGTAGLPRTLWVLTAGNGSLATDWLGEIQRWSPGFGWLLVDYPGYGACPGQPNPDSIRANYRAAFAALAADLGTTPENLKPRAGAFGQSLGAAAALDGASQLGLKRVVVLAPFTSLKDMANLLAGPPLSWLVTHTYDNRARLGELDRLGARVVIFHGSADEVIPVAMGRELAELHPNCVEFREVRGGRHNDLTSRVFREMGEALLKLSETPPASSNP